MYPQFCHVFTQILSDKFHKVLHIFRFAFESLAQFRILCCHTHRTGIQITYTHHHASHGYQWCGGKTKFLCTQNGCDGNITTAHQLTVCLDTDFISQTIHDQCLVCFGKSQLPWKSCIVDRTSRCCTGTSVITGDQDNLCTGFRYTGCNRTYPCFRYQFDRNSCLLVGIFQVINQLCQILDGVNIVVWRWGNQAYPWCRMSGLGNPRIDFSTRQMTTFTWFCALRHLDLYLLGTGQIFAGYTKSSGCHLFDCRASVVCSSGCRQTFITFTTLTGIGFAMEMVHGNGQCLMGFLRNGTIGHRTCLKSGDNVFHRFDFFNRDAFFRIIEVHQAAQISALLPVHAVGVFFKHGIIALSG